MLEFYTAKNPKARKRYKCDLCSKTIEAGEKYSYFTGKYEGEIFTSRNCLPCARMIDEYGTESGESEWTEDAIQDWLSEKYCDECEHGGWADDDCEYATVNCPHIREHFGETEGGGNEILHKAAEQEAE